MRDLFLFLFLPFFSIPCVTPHFVPTLYSSLTLPSYCRYGIDRRRQL